jgi:enoyl-CoA hydratase
MGLCNRVVPRGGAREAAISLARQLAAFPQATMLADRMSAYAQADLPMAQALHQEWERGRQCLGEALEGAARFAAGAGRNGRF